MYSNIFKTTLPSSSASLHQPDDGWNGRYSWLLSLKVIQPSLSVGLFKNRAWSFSRGEEAYVSDPAGTGSRSRGCRHEWVQVGAGCGMKSRGRRPRLLHSALYPTWTAITTMCLCYCARGFLVIVFWLGLYFLLQGGVPEQVLHRTGLQVPPFLLRKHPGRAVWGLRSDSSINVTHFLRICVVLNSDLFLRVWCSFHEWHSTICLKLLITF